MDDVFTLSFPAKPQYMLPLRLYISGIATRLGFDINDIDDVKTAVSEACGLLLPCEGNGGTITARLCVLEDGLGVTMNIEAKSGCRQIDDDELSLMIISSIARRCDIREEQGKKIGISLEFGK